MLKTLNSRKHFWFNFCKTLRHIFVKCVIAGLKTIRRPIKCSVKRSQSTNVEVVLNNKGGEKHRNDGLIFIQRTHAVEVLSYFINFGVLSPQIMPVGGFVGIIFDI